jgi:hypothetical protein
MFFSCVSPVAEIVNGLPTRKGYVLCSWHERKRVTETIQAPNSGCRLAVIVGLFVSFQLRKYTSFTRPRLLNERRAATLFAELQEHGMLASGDEQAVNLVQHVRRALTDHWNTLVNDGKLSDLTVLDVYDLKLTLLPTWIALRKQVSTLSLASVRTQFEAKLAAARGVLMDRSADARKVNAQIAALDPLLRKKNDDEMEPT